MAPAINTCIFWDSVAAIPNVRICDNTVFISTSLTVGLFKNKNKKEGCTGHFYIGFSIYNEY